MDFFGLGGPPVRLWDDGGGFWILVVFVVESDGFSFGFEFVVVGFGCEVVGDWVGFGGGVVLVNC